MKIKGHPIGKTHHRYTVFAVDPFDLYMLEDSMGRNIYVDEKYKRMFVPDILTQLYSNDSIINACNSYPSKG
jgi:hypothetical protein